MERSVCVIVGAGAGLGRALAARFSLGGYDVALVSRTETGSAVALESAARASSKVRTGFWSADATQPESVEHAIAQIEREMGDIDVLIYNVRDSFNRCDPLDMSYEELERVFRLEVVSAYAAARAAIPGMRSRGRGNVLFSSATAALRGSETHPLYSIGKFALRALSQSLAKAYAKDGVHVAHVRLDCDLDVPLMRELYADKYDPGSLANTDDVAQTYWWVHEQPRSAWSNEVELRPYTERWTY